MGKFFKTSYKIVADRWAGYEVLVWRWYWPFWVQLGGTNTHSNLEDAKRYLKRWKDTGGVYYAE